MHLTYRRSYCDVLKAKRLYEELFRHRRQADRKFSSALTVTFEESAMIQKFRTH